SEHIGGKECRSNVVFGKTSVPQLYGGNTPPDGPHQVDAIGGTFHTLRTKVDCRGSRRSCGTHAHRQIGQLCRLCIPEWLKGGKRSLTSFLRCSPPLVAGNYPVYFFLTERPVQIVWRHHAFIKRRCDVVLVVSYGIGRQPVK